MTPLQAARSLVRDARDFGLGFALKRAANATGSEMDVPVRGVGSVRVRASDSDVSTLRQVFVRRDYDLMKFAQGALVRARYEQLLALGRTPVIVDAGANIGAASLWFASQFPKARIVAVEPDAANAALCRRNTHAHGVQVMEAAIGARSGRVSLSNPADKSWAIRTERSETGAVEIVTIEQARAVALSGGAAGDLFIVKVDIEGFETDLFADNLDWLDAADVVFIELHDWMLPGQGSSRTVREALFHRKGDFLLAGENLVFVSERASTVPA